MEVYEKINYLLLEKSISKKEFADKLISLSPKLKATGTIPSLQTIYRYLNGQREIKIELIPYIAEVLNIPEQELFEFGIEYASSYNYRHSKEIREIIDLLQYLPHTKTIELKESLQRYRVLYEERLV